MFAAYQPDGTCTITTSARDAFDRMPSTDVLFVCTAEAQSAVDTERLQVGWRRFVETLPVVCNCDQFARVASLDRASDGSASWYRPPFVFDPRWVCALSDTRRAQLVTALARHRFDWIQTRGIVSMMFSLSLLTRLPLHEIAVARQTMLADALVEWVWMRDPLALDAPRLVLGDPTDSELRRFKGASVLKAKTGMHRGTVLFPDVRSLYPSVVLEYMQAEYPLIAELFRLMIELRANEHNPVHAASIKLITNSRFGTFKYGYYRDAELAERITAAGRRVQAESLEALQSSGITGVEVIAGDTDSLALAVQSDCDLAALQPRLVAALNGSRRFALYKADVDHFSAVFFINDKCWAGVRDADGQIVTRGFPQNRSVTPRFLLPSHREWTWRVLSGEAGDSAARLAWIEKRAAELRAARPPLNDLVVWPKPTNKHPDTDRGYLVVRPVQQHVPYSAYVRPGETRAPVDIDYLVKVYFVDELTRHSHVLG